MEGSRAQSFDVNNERLRAAQRRELPRADGAVSVDYFGHSCIRITSPSGVSVLIDPWRNDAAWGWWFSGDFPEIEVDIALSTHAHFDHDALHIPYAVSTMERMIGTYEVGDVRITGLADKHMSSAVGKTRWTEVQRDLDEDFSPPDNKLHMDNVIYGVETGGVSLVHWGDNRPVPDELVAQWLRDNPIDAIFLPVDESEHILGYTQADAIMDAYEPALTIPIHYRLPGVNTALSTLQPAEPWVREHSNVLDIGSARLLLSPGDHPRTGQTVATFGNHYMRQ